MPYLNIADRVQETTSTTGTGSLTLTGAPLGFSTFLSAFGASSKVVPYAITTATGEWEVGIGTYNGSTTLSRDTVTASSNSNALVNFGAGEKNVFVNASSFLLKQALPGDGSQAVVGPIESSFLFLGA